MISAIMITWVLYFSKEFMWITYIPSTQGLGIIQSTEKHYAWPKFSHLGKTGCCEVQTFWKLILWLQNCPCLQLIWLQHNWKVGHQNYGGKLTIFFQDFATSWENFFKAYFSFTCALNLNASRPFRKHKFDNTIGWKFQLSNHVDVPLVLFLQV